MAYRRKQVPTTGPSTFESPFSLASPPPPPLVGTPPEEGEAPSLAAQAIRASAAHRDSSLSSAYGDSVVFHHDSGRATVSSSRRPRELNNAHEYTPMKSLNESKYGFFGNLARKAKAFLDEENLPKPFEPIDSRTESTSTGNNKFDHTYQLPKSETAPVQKKSTEAIASSLSYIGGTLKNAFEEGKTIVGSTTQDIIQETRKLNIRRKGSGSNSNSNQQNEATGKWGQPYIPRTQTDYETQLKASRDVANAMAAKAKLLLRELKTVKADLAFAKERCAQLEDENKILRESQDKGGGPEDDDLIRLQLETLLAEKSRLAHENSVYARENRFLREIVEYHQLTMQDVIYVDEGIEEVTEVYPTQVLPPVTPNASKRGQKGQPTPSVVPDGCPVVPTSPKDAL